MTIHADFVKILKNECPDAFSETLMPQLCPDTVFIDGQVKLMKADDVKTWTVFLNVMFFKTIERCFKHGARVVVLGFDDYTYVPTSKTMTQVKRNKQVPALKFDEIDHLPAYMPDDWGSAMRNRTFKVKVIHKVLVETRAWFLDKLRQDHSWRTRTLVLDFQNRPQVLFAGGAREKAPAASGVVGGDFLSGSGGGADLDACLPPTESAVWRGRGECDIKAFFWMRYSRRLLVVSTDGDYIPLSMLQMLRDQGRQAMAESQTPCEIFIFRMHTKSAAEAVPDAKRRCVAQSSAKREEAAAPKKTRKYEFVQVSKLMACVERLLPSRAQHPVEQFCAMVALSGCDFALNLPRLGPKTIWKLRHRLTKLNMSQPAQLLCAMSILYWDTFVMKNTMPVGMTNETSFFEKLEEDDVKQQYGAIMRRIKLSKSLSPRIATVLWDADRANAHTLNIEWTMAYWNLLHDVPDPHSKDYGYMRDAKGRTHFAFST